MKDAHGLKGELFIVLYAGEAPWLRRLKILRLIPPAHAQGTRAQGPGTQGTSAQGLPPAAALLEVSLTSARLHKNGLIALSREIGDRTQAERLRGFELEIPESFFVSKPGEAIYLREIDGFSVVTAEAGEVGPIVGFSSNGAQDLLIVKTARGEFPVPFVEAFVVKIDYAAKRIEMSLPQGLLGDDEE